MTGTYAKSVFLMPTWGLGFHGFSDGSAEQTENDTLRDTAERTMAGDFRAIRSQQWADPRLQQHGSKRRPCVFEH
ncbi:hypothetical protein LA080_012092 [Diaporthe eres]|nr:hypothetical protein LA080_012092 [Diaporthe eres]